MGDGLRADDTPLRVLSVAYPLMTIGRGAAGGSEEVLRLMDAEITRRGFESIVIAGSGSKITGQLVATPAMNGDLTDAARATAQRLQGETIQAVLRNRHIDLIHFHGLDFLAYRPPYCSIPQLATLHLPVSWYPPDLFEQEHLVLNFVSHTQARSAPVRSAIAVITNGVDLDHLYVSEKKDDYLLWLGRICPEKGPHIALRVAHRLNLRLIIAGPLHPFASHRHYYEAEVKPYLDGRRVYIGSVAAGHKAELLSRARCLLVPSLVEETSSLVSMEAIGSGTPVIAFRSGALPEVVDHGITGYVVDSEEEMADAVALADRISTIECRRTAERRFSSQQMTSRYLELYAGLISRQPLHAR